MNVKGQPMKTGKYRSLLFILVLIVVCNANAAAQCAMCKTTAESDLSNGGSIANGLNTGILYLMAIPYLVIMTGGYIFFKKQVDAKVKGWKDRFFPAKEEK